MARIALAPLILATLALACARPAEPVERVRSEGLAESAALRDAWTETDAMSVARHSFTITRLVGNNLLITGGQKLGAFDTGDVYFQSTETYKPAIGIFTPASDMVSRRVAHTAELLPNGDVIVIGGAAGGETTSEIYDIATKTFGASPLPLNHPRVAAASVALTDGRVMVMGGDTDSALGTAEIYDHTTGVWTLVAPMASQRRRHTATVLDDGRVLVTGGYTYGPDGGATGVLTSVEIYDPMVDQWASAAPLSVPRQAHTATVLTGGRLLVAGGGTDTTITASAEMFDITAGTWTTVGPMSGARAIHTATALGNGAVLVAGGIDPTSSVLRTAEIFDPSALQWVVIGPLIHGRYSHSAAPLANGAVLVAGGENQATAEIYRPGKDGEPCNVGYECESQFCSDGVCCNQACNSTCTTCRQTLGKCEKVIAGTDPRLECGSGAACDAVCGEDAKCHGREGQACAEPACDQDGKVIEPLACTAAGGECPMTTVSCAPYRCGPLATSFGCLTQCRSVDDCAAGYACSQEGACVEPPDAADRTSGCAVGRDEPRDDISSWALFAAIGTFAAARRRRRR